MQEPQDGQQQSLKSDNSGFSLVPALGLSPSGWCPLRALSPQDLGDGQLSPQRCHASCGGQGSLPGSELSE